MSNTGTLKITTAGDREIVLTRVFDAPRHLVFEAWTRPDLVMRWLGPRDWPLVVCEIDLRVGGAYRFVARGPGGAEMGWSGVYREIVPPEKLVHTEAFDERWYPGDSLVTTVLTEQDGRTTVTSTVLYESQAARDAVLRSPMESGIAESYERLDELLESTAERDGSPAGA